MTVDRFPAFLVLFLLVTAISLSGQQEESAAMSGAFAPMAKGALKVLSEPAGAEITIDGKPMGITPLKIVNISAGLYRVALHLQGFLVSDSSVRIDADETRLLSHKLLPIPLPAAEKPPAPPACTLIIKTTPPGAALSINGQPSGTTPYRNDTLTPGSYKLRLEMAGYDPIEGSGTLNAGESRLIEKKLANLNGSLAVTTLPSGAALFLNEQPSGKTPYRSEKVAPGPYTLRLEMAGYESLSENITVIRDSAVSRQYSLTHTKKYGRMVRRIIFGSLALTAGGIGLYFNSQVSAAAEEQKKIQADYRAAGTGFDLYEQDYKDAKDKAKSSTRTRNIFYGIAGAFGLGFVISIPF
jgi:hypothetical protein